MDISTGLGVIRSIQRAVSAEPSPPVALGFLPDLILQRGVAMPVALLATDFTGSSLIFELAPQSDALPAGLALSTTGVLSGTPTSTVSGLNIVIQATNAQGETTSEFSLVVVDMLLDFDATIAGLSLNDTYGLSATSGVALTAEAAGFTADIPTGLTYQWKTIESGEIAGGTGATFTPVAALYDGEQLYCTITPQGYPSKDTGIAIIRHVAPEFLSTPGEQFWDVDTGVQAIDMTTHVSGEALVWSVAAQGGTISPATGQLSIRTESQAIGATARVRALNSGGAVDIVFPFTVEDIEAGPGPDLGAPILDDATNTIGLVLDEVSTVYWRRDAVGTNPDPSDVMLGGGYDGGSFSVVAGANELEIDFATGNDGAQEISFVAASLASEPSLVRTVNIDIDTEAPLLIASQPFAGETGVAAATTPILTYSKPVTAGVGRVTLFDVTAGVSADVFDVIEDVGSGVGQIAFSDTMITLTPSAPLVSGHNYALLIDEGAIRDAPGNSAPAITSTSELSFLTGESATFDFSFGSGFTTEQPAIWASLEANAFNVVPVHQSAESWIGYAGDTTAGGIIGQKSGNYPQLRFSVPVEIGKTYSVDVDLPIGEGNWNGPLRAKIGSAIDQSDYAQIDESEAGQPRVVEVRGLQLTASTTQLWFAIIVQTSTSGSVGGQPAISMLRIQEV